MIFLFLILSSILNNLPAILCLISVARLIETDRKQKLGLALGRQQIATKAGIYFYLNQRNLLECRNMDKFSFPSTPAAVFGNWQKFSARQKCQNENIHEIAFTYAFTFPLMLTFTLTYTESTKKFPS